MTRAVAVAGSIRISVVTSWSISNLSQSARTSASISITAETRCGPSPSLARNGAGSATQRSRPCRPAPDALAPKQERESFVSSSGDLLVEPGQKLGDEMDVQDRE